MQELHRVLLKMPVNMAEYGSEYVSYNTQRKATLQVNEYLLRDGRIHNPVEDLRQSALEN